VSEDIKFVQNVGDFDGIVDITDNAPTLGFCEYGSHGFEPVKAAVEVPVSPWKFCSGMDKLAISVGGIRKWQEVG